HIDLALHYYGVHVLCFSSRRRHTSFSRDWSSDVCSSDLPNRKNRRSTVQDRPPKPQKSTLNRARPPTQTAKIDAQPCKTAKKSGTGRASWSEEGGGGTRCGW